MGSNLGDDLYRTFVFLLWCRNRMKEFDGICDFEEQEVVRINLLREEIHHLNIVIYNVVKDEIQILDGQKEVVHYGLPT